jgi:hypothetical protein
LDNFPHTAVAPFAFFGLAHAVDVFRIGHVDTPLFSANPSGAHEKRSLSKFHLPDSEKEKIAKRHEDGKSGLPEEVTNHETLGAAEPPNLYLPVIPFSPEYRGRGVKIFAPCEDFECP